MRWCVKRIIFSKILFLKINIILSVKKIVVMPIKNEGWILDCSLSCASLWADHIIVADQSSTDNSAKICQSYKKVIYILNEATNLDQSYARQILLEKTRDLFGNDNIILALDADEILSSNFINNQDFNGIVDKLNPGQSLKLHWVMVFDELSKYINDKKSVWTNNYKHFIFRDDGKYNFSNKKTSEPRMPDEYTKNSFYYDEVKVLHLQFIDMERMLSKQRRYRMADYLEKQNFLKAVKVNRMYFITKKLSDLRKDVLPVNWLNNYDNINLKIKTEYLYWFDFEVLKIFKQYGIKLFSWLDIWDIDWDKKRLVAIEQGYGSEIPDYKINDPRNILQKIYHKKLQNFLSDNSLIYKLFKLIRLK